MIHHEMAAISKALSALGAVGVVCLLPMATFSPPIAYLCAGIGGLSALTFAVACGLQRQSRLAVWVSVAIVVCAIASPLLMIWLPPVDGAGEAIGRALPFVLVSGYFAIVSYRWITRIAGNNSGGRRKP